MQKVVGSSPIIRSRKALEIQPFSQVLGLGPRPLGPDTEEAEQAREDRTELAARLDALSEASSFSSWPTAAKSCSPTAQAAVSN